MPPADSDSSRQASNRKHVTSACLKCRQRKVRCDGQQPNCSFCSTRGYTCEWSPSVDGRRLNRPHVKNAQLEREVEHLRQLLALHNIAAPSQAEIRAFTAEATGLDDTETPPVPTTSAYKAVDSLHFDAASGSLSFRGPTSIPGRVAPQEGDLGQEDWLPGPASPHLDLQLNISLSTSNHLLDLFFRHFNDFLAWVDEAAFRAGLAAQSHPTLSPTTAYYSPFLHLCILSQAAHLTSDPEQHFSPDGSPGTRGWVYLRSALSLLNGELERPRPSTVIGLTLLMSGLSDAGKVSLAWLYSGIAIRLSQDIGLQVNSSSLVDRGILTEAELRQREDAFWTVYFQDKLVSLYVGRAPAISPDDFDVLLPSPHDDPLKAAFISLGTLISRLVTSLYSIRREKSTTSSAVVELRKDIQTWYDNLALSLRLPEGPLVPSQNIFMLHLLYNLVVILYYRPFLRRHSLDTLEGRRCLTAALDSTTLACQFDSAIGIRLAFTTMTQCLFVPASCLVLLLADLYGDKARQTEIGQIRAALDQLSTLLTALSDTWGTAQQAVAALVSLKREYAVDDAPPSAENVAPALPTTTLDEQFAAWQPDWPPLNLTFGWDAVEDPLGLQQMGIW
ncbi:hypothetical protein JCM10207_005819 [Rhodosporidiobolus poonsookiae]